MKNDQVKTKPVAKVRLGNISAAIWQNDGENGPWFNVTFARTYKEGSEFRSAQSFGRSDLLALAKAADIAHTRIVELEGRRHQAA